MRCGILVLAAVAVALSTEARAQGRITGTVTAAQDGRPIPGAAVTVVGTNRTGATDASGRYEIADAPSGTQLVRVRLLGFAPLTQTVWVPYPTTTTPSSWSRPRCSSRASSSLGTAPRSDAT